jgi:hypothetical protein
MQISVYKFVVYVAACKAYAEAIPRLSKELYFFLNLRARAKERLYHFSYF